MPWANPTTEMRRAKKRRYRASLYAKGLTATGTVPKHPEWARRLHPTGCICRDCLFPPCEREPIVHRVTMSGRA